MNSNYLVKVLFVLACFFAVTTSCRSPKNFKKAYALVNKDTCYIKLKGSRRLMAHDPISLFENKLYDDSILIPVPGFKSDTIFGKVIPVRKGYYKYAGFLLISGNKLEVNLFYLNTDDKKKDPVEWNGNYILVRPN